MKKTLVRSFNHPVWGDCEIFIQEYSNGGHSVIIETFHKDFGINEPLATLSLWTDGSDNLPIDQFFLKDWSENIELARFCEESGFIEPVSPPLYARTGFITAQVYKLTRKVD